MTPDITITNSNQRRRLLSNFSPMMKSIVLFKIRDAFVYNLPFRVQMAIDKESRGFVLLQSARTRRWSPRRIILMDCRPWVKLHGQIVASSAIIIIGPTISPSVIYSKFTFPIDRGEFDGWNVNVLRPTATSASTLSSSFRKGWIRQDEYGEYLYFKPLIPVYFF